MSKTKTILINLLGAAAIAAFTAGTALAQFSGTFASGGAVYDGGPDQVGSMPNSSRAGIGVAVDTITVGGPYIYTVNLSSPTTNSSYLIVRYNSSGVAISSVAFSKGAGFGEHPAIAVGPGGFVYVAGDVAEVPFVSVDSYDGLLLKYSPTLTFIASTTFHAITGGAYDSFMAVAADASGVYVTGASATSLINNDGEMVAIKYSPALTVISSRTSNEFPLFTGDGFSESGNAIVLGPGGVYVAGPVNTAPNSGQVCSVFQYTRSMVFVSSAVLPGVTNCYAAAGGLGGLYLAGYRDNGDFSYGAVTARFGYNLAFVSSTTFVGGGYGFNYAAAADTLGNVYVTGNALGSNEDFMLLKYDQFLNLVSSAAYSAPLQDIGYGVAVDGANRAYAAMYTDNGTNAVLRLQRYGYTPASVFSGNFSGPTGAIYDGGDYDSAEVVAVDTVTAGGPYVYAAGKSFNPATGLEEAVLIKYDNLGNKMASDRVGGAFSGAFKTIKVLADGTVVVAGNSPTGNGDIILRSYDQNFSLLVSTNLPGNDIFSLDAGSGYIYAVGSYGNFGNGWNLMRLTMGLQPSYSFYFDETGDSNDFASGVRVRPDGSVLVTGGINSGGLQQWHARVYDSTLSSLISSGTYNVNLPTSTYVTSWPAMGPAGDYYLVGAYPHGVDSDGLIVHFAPNHTALHTYRMGSVNSGIYARPAIDALGNLVVGAYGDVPAAPPYWVNKFSSALTVISTVSTPYLGFTAALDASGNSYVVSVENFNNEHDPANNFHTLKVNTSGAALGFNGDFTSPGGSNYDSGQFDSGSAAEIYGGDIYMAGQAGAVGGLLVRYDSAGTVLSSAVLSGVGFTGVRVNSNGVYLSAQGGGTGFVVARYDRNTLGFISSATLAGDTSARDIALDAAGNVYVAGSNWGEAGGLNDYKVAKFSPALAFISSVAYNAGGQDEGRGIAIFDNYVYLTGSSLQGNTTHFVTVKYFANTLTPAGFSHDYSAAAYVDADHPVGSKIDVNTDGSNIYVAASGSNKSILTLHYNSALSLVGEDTFPSDNYAQGVDVRVNVASEVFVLGGYNSGLSDYPLVIKYDKDLVFKSSAAVQHNYGFEPMALGVDTYGVGMPVYVTGVYFANGSANQSDWNMRTVKFPPLGDGGAVLRQISGSADYLTYDPQAILTVWVSTSMDFRGTRYETHLPPAGSITPFSISNVPPGVYYMAMTAGQAQVAFSTEPWGVHGQLGTPTAIDVTAGDASGISVTLTDGNVMPNPFSAASQAPAWVSCSLSFASGGDCRVNGTSSYGTAVYAASTSTYLLSTNLTHSAIVRFDASGTVVSSVTAKYATFNDIKLNPVTGDLYVAAQGPGSGVQLYRYTPGLVFVSSYAAAGYQGARQLDFDGDGSVYAVSTVDSGGANGYDVRVIRIGSDLTSGYAEAVYPSAGPDQGLGIHVVDSDVFVAAKLHPVSTDQAAVLKFNLALTYSGDGAVASSLPRLYPEGQGFNYFRLVSDPTDVYLGFSTDLGVSTGAAVYRFTRSNLANGGYSSATVMGASGFGAFATYGTDFFVTGRGVANQPRVVRMQLGSLNEVAAFNANVSGLGYGMDPGALSISGSYGYLGGVLPSGGPSLGAGVAKFSLNGAAAAFDGSASFDAMADGAGGAYQLYDSTTAADGLRRFFVRRVSAAGAQLWLQAASTSFYAIPDSEDEAYLAPDGSGGVLAAWTQGGTPFVQRYTSGGVQQWLPNGVIMSTGAALGAKFQKTSDGGLAAMIIYDAGGASLATVVQKMNNSGQCLWPSGTAANCFLSAGTAIPFTDMIGDASLAEGQAGSLWALWSGDNGSGRLEVNAARVGAGGGFAVNPKVLASDLSFDLGKSLYGLDAGDGGVYAVWASSENTQMKLYSRRFLADGNAHAGWGSALQLTGYLYNNYADIELARDPEGFAVMYSTMGWNNMASEVRVVRASATVNQLAPGWTIGGLLLGRTIDGLGGLVYDGSLYHMDWNQWATGLPPGNYHRVDYQKMTPDGQLAFSPSFAVGMSSNCLNMAISTNGAGGALVSWMERTGGSVLPVQVSISSSVGAIVVPVFSGNFAQPGGAYFTGPGFDHGMDAAYYNGSVYVVGYSSTAGGMLIKYDQAGNKLRSVSNPAYPFMGVAVNDNGVYVAAQGNGTGFVTLKYDQSFSLVASTTLAGDSSARKLALDAAGNVYVVGSNWGEMDSSKDYKIVKYDQNLQPLAGPVLYNAGGDDEGRDIAVSGGSVYVTGDSVQPGDVPAYKYVTTLFDTSLNQIGGTAAEMANAYIADPYALRLAVNQVSGDVYVGGTQGTEESRRPVLVRYNSGLESKDQVTFENGQYGLGFDVAVDTRGSVYAMVKDMTGAEDRAGLLRLTPSLVLVSSAVSPSIGVKFYGQGLALNPLDGSVYAAGFTDNAGDTDIHTMRFAPLPVAHPSAAGEIPLSLTDLGDAGISSAYGGGVFMAAYQYDGHYIAARPVSAAGTPGAELRLDPVADYASGGAPAVASNGTDFLIVWNTDAPGYSNYIRAQRVSAAGAKLGASFWINQQAGPLDGAASDGSGYLVVWSSGPDTGTRAMRGQRLSAAGALVGQPLDISENGSARESRRAAAYGSGRYFVAWSQDDNDAVVMGRFVNADGTFDGAEFVVDASTMPSDNPVTVAASHIGYFVAFHDQTEGGFGVYGKLVSYDGSVAASTRAFSSAAAAKFYADVIWDGSRYQASWTEAPFTDGASVHMRYYDYAGAPLGPDTTLASSVGGWAPFGIGLAYAPSGKTLALLNREKTPGTFGDTSDLYGLLVSTGAAPALLPTVTVSTFNAAPGNYFGQQEAPALKLDVRTAAGRTTASSIRVHVNPGRPYANVSAVGLYADSDADGIWTQRDEFISSAPVAGQFATLGFPPGTLIDTTPGVIFLTLTPAAGSVGSSVNLAVDVATHVFTAGTMAPQAFYPVTSPATPVNLFAPIATLAQSAPGASLTSVSLAWTYPQAVPPGSHVVVHFSTDTFDLRFAPEYPSFVIPLETGVVSGSVGTWTSPDLTKVTDGLRVFPQYFAAWIYNGVSTSPASNLAQNLYFPVTASPDGSAVLRLRAGMTAQEARVARSPDGQRTLTAVTFDSGSRYVMLRDSLGQQFFYNDVADPSLVVKRLAADNAGGAYLLTQGQGGDRVVKVASDGSVAWNVSPFDGETPKAILYGGSAVYLAAEIAGTATDIKLFKLDPANGSPLYSTVYNLAPGSDDFVNSIAFTSDASGAAYIYAAGVSDGSAVVHKFYDNGAGFLPQAGNWPLRHVNPAGDSSDALVVKADPNSNLVVAGTELRNDLSQYRNVWVNKFNQFGLQMFAAPGRYNNQQANSDDVPAAIDFDSYGGIHVAGYSDMTPLGRGKDLLLARFGASGQLMSAGVYGGADDDYATGVAASSDSYVNASGLFGADGVYGVYSAPLGAGGAAAQFFSAVEGAYTGSVDLVWNYTGALPAGSTFYVQVSSAAAPAWNRAAAQYVVNPPAQGPGGVQAFTVGGLTTLRYPGQPPAETRGLPYQFKVWIASAGAAPTELPAAQSYARTPSAYDNTQYFGNERLSFMSGLSQPPSAVAADGQYVYHAFAGYADGVNAGFGLRKYDTGKYLEWTKFFNHAQDRAYYVGAMTRDAAGNFYIVGSQSPSSPNGIPYMSPAKDLWIAKLSPEGELLWSYSRDEGQGGKDELNAVALEGNYLYVAGVASDTVNGLAAFAAKYGVSAATGPVRVWASKLNGSGAAGYDEAYGVAVGTAVFVSGTMLNANNDAFIAALNKADGTSLAANTYNDSGPEDRGYGLALTVTAPPYLYMGGMVTRWELAGSAFVEKHDAALLQYSLSGALVGPLVSSSTYNGKDNLNDSIYAVKADATGVIVAGYEGSVSFGTNSIYRKFAHGAGPLAERIMWSRGFDFGAEGDDAAYGLDVDASGRVYSAVMLRNENPGFYYFPEPNFSVTAAPNYVPGSVRLEWMSEEYLAGGTTFYVQYSTFGAGTAWSAFSAQSVTNADADIWVGANVSRTVYGLNTGRDAQGNSIAPQYYFKVWYSTPGAVSPVLVSPAAAASRPSDGWAFESMSMYPNDSKLFVMGDYQPSYYGEENMEFPGVARDPLGNLYTLANMDWNGSQGFAVKKFTSAMQPVWTRYYVPGEWYQVRANKMAADAAGNLYITGYERAFNSATGRDLFFMKLGPAGLVWKTVVDFAGGDDAGHGVALDGSGNAYAAGQVYAGAANDEDAFVVKFGPTGVVLASATYNGTANDDDAAYSVAAQGGNVYVAGSAEISAKGSQFWMARYDASLSAPLTATLGDDDGGGFQEAAFSVAIATHGAVYFAGQLYTADNDSLDAAVVKTSADFTTEWAQRYNSQANGADSVRAVALDLAGAAFAAGYTERYDINQDKNLWLRKFATDGSELLTQEFNASAIQGGDAYAQGPSSDEGFSIAVGTMGYVSVGGKFGGYYGMYRYKQTNLLTVNPVLTVAVSSGAAGTPFPGVGVTLIPFSQTGGIDISGSTSTVTGPSGSVAFTVPAGKQYFIALDKQGFSPAIRDQLMDPYGSYFVQPNADLAKAYTLTARSAADPYYPLTVRISSATQRDFVMAEVFFTATGEKAAYGVAQVPAGQSSATITVSNLPPAPAGSYTLGVTIPARGLARSVPMAALFPQTSSYLVVMSTMAGAVATTGGFDVGASTTPASVEGVVRSTGTLAPIEQARVMLYNESCRNSPCAFNSYETLTDVNGKFAFYGVAPSTVSYFLSAQKANYKRGSFSGVYITTASATAGFREFQLDKATYTLRGYIRYRDLPVPNADVMVWGDGNSYGAGADSYRNGPGMDGDARTKTGADGSFVFSTATANGLPDGQVRMTVSFMGNWMELNKGNKQSSAMDSDYVRIVISSQGATGAGGNCSKGRVWKLSALTGACQSLANGEVNFNLMPPSQNDYALLSGSVTFVTTYTVTDAFPLVISTGAPITVMAMQDCSNCNNKSMGFAVISGTYTVSYATYTITLSTGVSYYTRVTSNEWGEVSSFDDRADFRSTMTTSVRMNFVVTKAGRLSGVVKLPDGGNYKPVYGTGMSDPARHKLDVEVRGQNVSVNEGWSVDDYGAFEFPNLAPGLYTVSLRPEGEAFRWAAPTVTDLSVVAGKTTQVTLKLENGLYVQPQIIGLPDISTPTWSYIMVPVPSGTEMSQKRVTDMFFGDNTFAFSYSTATQTWEKKIMQVGQYDFYLMMGAQYNPEGGGDRQLSYDQFGNFIGKVKGFNVQRNDATPNLGTEAQPIPVNVLGSLGQDTFEGTIAGSRLYTDADITRFFANMNELFTVIPAVMIYDAAGDLRGYTAGLPRQSDFEAFWNAMGQQDLAQMRAYMDTHLGRFMVAGMPPGRYTVVFNNPNYPPVAKEVTLPLADSYNGVYPFSFDEQRIRVGTVYGTVRSSATGEALANAVVYLKHKTVEKFAATGADGSFAFDNMPSGIYRLEVTREGFVKAGEKTTLAGDDSTRLDFWLHASQTNMTGKVYMSKFPSPVTKSGVKIVAYDETFNVEHPTEYLPKIEATTNDSGEYELSGVVPGHNYKVTAFHGGKQTFTLDVASETVTEGTTYLPDIVMRDVPPQIVLKVRKSPDSPNKADVTIKSPKMLVTTPVCKINPGESYVATSAVSLALVPGPNNTYAGQFTISRSQPYYNVYVAAGDGSSRMEKSVTFSPNNAAKTEQYVQDEAIQGGEVQMDRESEEYSGLELDAGGLAYNSGGGASALSYGTASNGGLVGGFFSSLPSVRTVKTAKGDLSLTQAITDLMASEVYNMELQNASANKPFTLTLKYDKEKAADGANLRIYQYDETTGGWNEVPGNYTTDPMLGVLAVDVANLTNATEGVSAALTPLGRKRYGMSAVVNGRYVPSAASTSQSGRFAVFTARPSPNVAYAGSDYAVANLPNPFNLKDKTVTNLEGTAAFSGATTYTTRGTLIKYHLPSGKSGSVKFVIYNLAGEKVRTISDGSRAGGNMYYSEWDGRNDNNQDVASGVYFMLTYVDGEKIGAKAHKLAVIK